MRLLFATLSLLLVSACATVAPPPTDKAEVQAYPVWLEMKPGYAETCLQGGGCVPMTQGELQQMTLEIMNRTMQACRRLPSI